MPTKSKDALTMQQELITVNYPNGVEHNFKPGEYVFSDATSLLSFLDDRYPEFTSVVIVGLPTKSNPAKDKRK